MRKKRVKEEEKMREISKGKRRKEGKKEEKEKKCKKGTIRGRKREKGMSQTRYNNQVVRTQIVNKQSTDNQIDTETTKIQHNRQQSTNSQQVNEQVETSMVLLAYF